MSNFTLEREPEIIHQANPAAEAVIFEDATVLSTEVALGVLARRAATADFYSLLTESRGSSAETVESWKSERDRWNDEATNLLVKERLCPKLYKKYHSTYSAFFSQMNRPNSNSAEPLIY